MKIYEVDYYDGEELVGIKLFTNQSLANTCVRYMVAEGRRAEKQTWNSIRDFVMGFYEDSWSDGEVLDLLCELDDGDSDHHAEITLGK